MIKLPPRDTSQPRTHYADVAVVLPAFNEALSVAATVRAFQHALPGAHLVVCDNNSADATADEAERAGATVIAEPAGGKGNAIRRLLASVEADIIVMSDADATYDAQAAVAMIAQLEAEHLDMVTGVRQASDERAFRRGHVLGNRLFNGLFSRLFSVTTRDVFSGFRVLSGRFARALPVQSSGFEIETEMSAVAATLKLSCGEHHVRYVPRQLGSTSKLRTYRDGFHILFSYVHLMRSFQPLRLYGFMAVSIMLLSLLIGLPIVVEFLQTGLVPRFPSAILASSLAIIAMIILAAGSILDAIARSRIEHLQLMIKLKER